MEFPGFLGNAPVKEALSAAFAAGRFPHTLLLQGESGTGKRSLAALLSQALVCRSRDSAPCGHCPSCVRARAGSHPDIRRVEGTGSSGALSVEAVRQMAEDACRMPEEADCSVYTVLLGDRTLPAAQNKLLKLIEEPPPSAVFLLICTHAQNLLPTICSRAQIFTLRPPALEEAAQWLAEHAAASPERAQELAALCGGNLGRMQEELQGGQAGRAFALACQIAAALLERGSHPLLKAAAPLSKDRELFRQVLVRLTVIFRDALALRCGGTGGLGGAEQLAEQLGALPRERLLALPELAETCRQRLERNANTGLLAAWFCAQLKRA